MDILVPCRDLSIATACTLQSSKLVSRLMHQHLVVAVFPSRATLDPWPEQGNGIAQHSPRIMHTGTTVKHHPTNARPGQRLALLVELLLSSQVISRAFGVSPSIAHSARSFPTRRMARSGAQGSVKWKKAIRPRFTF
ncbi:hypothetical protein KY284_035937 [Solanum tuberosum]|nr:hypothetical protein KY284_035937 [Solanum tuberosum]